MPNTNNFSYNKTFHVVIPFEQLEGFNKKAQESEQIVKKLLDNTTPRGKLLQEMLKRN